MTDPSSSTSSSAPNGKFKKQEDDDVLKLVESLSDADAERVYNTLRRRRRCRQGEKSNINAPSPSSSSSSSEDDGSSSCDDHSNVDNVRKMVKRNPEMYEGTRWYVPKWWRQQQQQQSDDNGNKNNSSGKKPEDASSLCSCSYAFSVPAPAPSSPLSPSSSPSAKKDGDADDVDDGDDTPGLTITCCGSYRLSHLNVASITLRVCFLVLFWWLMWLALPQNLTILGGALFDMLVCFVVSFFFGTLLGKLFDIPPLLFVFGMGILWGNISSPQYLTSGISSGIRTFVSRAALTIILLRSGLAMSWKTIRPASWNILSMSFFPMLVEVVVHGFVASSLIDYGGSKMWPFLQAMTASPSASAVVGATVLDMRARGYGITRGPGVLLVPSVILDFTLGIWGINFVAELVFRDEENSNLGLAIAKGPLQILLGPLVGVGLGFVWYYCVLLVFFAEAQKLPSKQNNGSKSNKDDDNSWRCGDYTLSFVRRVSNLGLASMTVIGMICVFFGYFYNLAGGACLACTFLAATGHHLLVAEEEQIEMEREHHHQHNSSRQRTGNNVDGGGGGDAKNHEPTSSFETINQQQQQQQQQQQKREEDGDADADDDQDSDQETVATITKTTVIPPPEHFVKVKTNMADDLKDLWDWFVMPCLFAFSGSAIRVDTMFAADFVGKSIACIFVGVVARVVVCTICCWSFDMTPAERVISMIASAGRGSAQVALGGYALTLVEEKPGGGTAAEKLYGAHVYDTATLGVIIMGPIAIVLLTRVLPCFGLTDEAYYLKEEEERDRQQQRAVEEKEAGADDVETTEMEKRKL